MKEISGAATGHALHPHELDGLHLSCIPRARHAGEVYDLRDRRVRDASAGELRRLAVWEKRKWKRTGYGPDAGYAI
eukprot:gene16818-biopygen20318